MHPYPHMWQNATGNVAAPTLNVTAHVDLNLVGDRVAVRDVLNFSYLEAETQKLQRTMILCLDL